VTVDTRGATEVVKTAGDTKVNREPYRLNRTVKRVENTDRDSLRRGLAGVFATRGWLGGLAALSLACGTASQADARDPVGVEIPASSTRDRPLPPLPARVAAALPPGADRECLRELVDAGVPFVTFGSLRGVRTPVQIVGPIRGIRLLSPVKRPAFMDCQLARALTEAAPLFRRLHVTGLTFSGAYDYRPRRGSHQLSEHAHGLAIDVHVIETAEGSLDVERDFPRDAGRWRATAGDAGALPACVGDPALPAGRALRRLACSLRLQSALRLILTPDDNHDHRNHFHIESYPDRERPLLTAGSPRHRAVRHGHSARHRHAGARR
jgi:hypothetical protein